MLKRFEVVAVHAEVDDKLKTYVRRKIGGLDRYIARHNRGSAHCEVHLKHHKTRNHNSATCEVTLHLPQQNIIIKEDAINLYAAVDIVEAKLKQQLQKYKDRHGNGKTHRRLFARLRRKSNI